MSDDGTAMSADEGRFRDLPESNATEPRLSRNALVTQRVAITLLLPFLVAIVVALAITLSSVAPAVRLIAESQVSPIIALTLLLLYFESRGRRWSFAGAAILGALGVGLRLIVNTQPQLEVGGGLPIVVTVIYATLGFLVIASSLWAYLSLRRE
ncbi:MAG: hypothetical protein L3K10_00450 [Thermoplasmata archaeon]|nr:hypothetical protein [Thermoplasmata archaeon]